MSSGQWDSEAGVWLNEMAPSAVDDLPDPLYIFGYGSLIWKPSDLLEKFISYPCSCFGYHRWFAQRSMDHRGNPIFPGLVATMIEDSYLAEQGFKENTCENAECIGVVYHVNGEKVKELIQELDFRERGGYTRHTITIKLHKDTPVHRQGDIVEAIVYTGSTSNPNFNLHTNIAEAAAIISVAKGPSGWNTEYLYQLCNAVRSLNLTDTHLTELEREVRLHAGTREQNMYYQTIRRLREKERERERR